MQPRQIAGRGKAGPGQDARIARTGHRHTGSRMSGQHQPILGPRHGAKGLHQHLGLFVGRLTTGQQQHHRRVVQPQFGPRLLPPGLGISPVVGGMGDDPQLGHRHRPHRPHRRHGGQRMHMDHVGQFEQPRPQIGQPQFQRRIMRDQVVHRPDQPPAAGPKARHVIKEPFGTGTFGPQHRILPMQVKHRARSGPRRQGRQRRINPAGSRLDHRGEPVIDQRLHRICGAIIGEKGQCDGPVGAGQEHRISLGLHCRPLRGRPDQWHDFVFNFADSLLD